MTDAPSLARAGDVVDVRVRAIAAGGAGVADLPDGRVAFVQRTAPGDHARVSLVKSRPRWAEARVERLIDVAADRVAPPCPLYDRCGGCRLQHLPYAAQLRWKGRMVADALQRIAKAGPVEPPEVVPSPEVLGYRSRVSFTLRRLRGGRVVAGYHALGSPAHVVDVETCLLAAEPIPAVWRALRAGWGHGARLLPDGGRLRLTLRSADGGVELLVDGGVPGWDAGPLLEATDGLTAVWHRPDREGRGAAELVAGTRGAGGGVAFEQVNRAAADLLRAHVRAEIERHAPEPGKAVDAYCGVGTYGRTLSREGWRVTGIELDPAAAATAATDAPEGFDVVVGAVEDVLGRALPAELLIANPPRAGLGPDVTTIIGREPPDVVLYVSCDPGTLARDVAALSGSHHVAALTCFDLFPQTAHVETVAVLTRSSGEAR